MTAAQPSGAQIAPVLAGVAILRRIAVEVGADRPRNHPLAFGIATHRTAELLDHAHRLMPHGQPLLNGIFPFENMHVRTANRGGGDPDQSIVGTHIGNGFFNDFNAPFFNKGGGFHRLAHRLLRLCMGKRLHKRRISVQMNT